MTKRRSRAVWPRRRDPSRSKVLCYHWDTIIESLLKLTKTASLSTCWAKKKTNIFFLTSRIYRLLTRIYSLHENIAGRIRKQRRRLFRDPKPNSWGLQSDLDEQCQRICNCAYHHRACRALDMLFLKSEKIFNWFCSFSTIDKICNILKFIKLIK